MRILTDVSPQNLNLDSKNPRFILPDSGETQVNIRKYLISQEDIIGLARDIVDYGGLMPGERIVITEEEKKYVVLEGNRRTCACQLLLNPSLIPTEYIDKFPTATEDVKANIRAITIDVIDSREIARRFLATRHIERAREWSTISKMRFCHEDYVNGHPVSQINQRTGISVGVINKYIRNYNILMRGISGSWTEQEKKKLYLLDIKPDRLLRMFTLKETSQTLQLYYDENFILRSNMLSDADVDLVIHIWTKKAFIDQEMDTRTQFGSFLGNDKSTGACRFIEDVLQQYIVINTDNANGKENISTTDAPNNTPSETPQALPSRGVSKKASSDDQQSKSQNATNSKTPNTNKGGPGISPFFSQLNWSNVKEDHHNGKGVIMVCAELEKISKKDVFIANYPICTAFIIRALIEQSFKYHAKEKGYWSTIMCEYHKKASRSGDPQLSFIIKQYEANLGTWIPDQTVRRAFDVVFRSKKQVDKFNLVIHSPEVYTLHPDTLLAIPNEGCLAIVNYLLS